VPRRAGGANENAPETNHRGVVRHWLPA